MEVNNLTTQNLIAKNIQYRVPLYQRPYVWNEDEQWQYLWEDILRIAETMIANNTTRPHFMGATVLERENVPPGKQRVRLVIDGQQRLTTLQLITKACLDIAHRYGLTQYEEAFSSMAFNNHALNESQDDRFTVLPTNADRDTFRLLMDVRTPEEVLLAMGLRQNAVSTGKEISDAYIYFYRKINDWICENNEPEKLLATLYGVISDKLVMVVILLGEEDDAQMIFETMNARGVPLLAADLIKNSILNELGRAGEPVKDIYQKYWKDFDEDTKFWRKKVGRGYARKPRLELLVQHAISLISEQAVTPSDLYLSYKNYVKSGRAVAAMDRLKRLRSIGLIYKRLVKRDVDLRFQTFLYRLDAMNTGTAYPFLISLLESHPGKTELHKKVVKRIESFLVRRMICRLSTRGYNYLFLDLVPLTRLNADEMVAAVEARLLENEGDNERWPDEEEFYSAWMELQFYLRLPRARARMILEALEEEKRSKKAGDQSCPRNLTIEHLLPQNWRKYWPIPADTDQSKAQIRREKLLHSIGNLTLLSEKLNAAQKNHPWHDFTDDAGEIIPGKQSELEKHTVLYLNKDLARLNGWDEDCIEKRSEELFNVAKKVWTYPKSFKDSPTKHLAYDSSYS